MCLPILTVKYLHDVYPARTDDPIRICTHMQLIKIEVHCKNGRGQEYRSGSQCRAR